MVETRSAVRSRSQTPAAENSTKTKSRTLTSNNGKKEQAERKRSKPEDKQMKSTQRTITSTSTEASRWQSWWIRIFWSFVLVFGFIVVVMSGHFYVLCLVILIQLSCFKEIIAIAFRKSSENENTKRPRFFRTLNWYFLFTTNYLLFGIDFAKTMKQVALQTRLKDTQIISFLENLVIHHHFISFSLYVFGILLFVLTLQRGFLKSQFRQFGWTHATLLIVVFQSSFITANVYNGLFWFLLSVSIIICNDCTAYIFGFFFGRTPLIALSPKKTWEGFIGGFLSTVIFGFLVARFLASFDYFVCPIKELTITPFVTVLECERHQRFELEEYSLPSFLNFFGEEVSLYPVQIDGLMLSIFGSIIAPFGGFFASGFKRAFKVKDFQDLIPGHGGVVDRFDCQLLMGSFTYVYYGSIMYSSMISIELIMSRLAEFDFNQQKQLLHILEQNLEIK